VRVVLDTNLWISFLFGKAMDDLLRYLEEASVTILTDERKFEEFEMVIARPKIKKVVGPDRIAIMRAFAHRQTIVKAKRRVTACRDPNDDYLLEIAVAGKADCIITGDFDLKALDPFLGIRIMGYRDFKNLLARSKEGRGSRS
jgi:putative PIN family toxin of toxin-antitoxin system